MFCALYVEFSVNPLSLFQLTLSNFSLNLFGDGKEAFGSAFFMGNSHVIYFNAHSVGIEASTIP